MHRYWLLVSSSNDKNKTNYFDNLHMQYKLINVFVEKWVKEFVNWFLAKTSSTISCWLDQM